MRRQPIGRPGDFYCAWRQAGQGPVDRFARREFNSPCGPKIVFYSAGRDVLEWPCRGRTLFFLNGIVTSELRAMRSIDRPGKVSNRPVSTRFPDDARYAVRFSKLGAAGVWAGAQFLFSRPGARPAWKDGRVVAGGQRRCWQSGVRMPGVASGPTRQPNAAAPRGMRITSGKRAECDQAWTWAGFYGMDRSIDLDVGPCRINRIFTTIAARCRSGAVLSKRVYDFGLDNGFGRFVPATGREKTAGIGRRCLFSILSRKRFATLNCMT